MICFLSVWLFDGNPYALQQGEPEPFLIIFLNEFLLIDFVIHSEKKTSNEENNTLSAKYIFQHLVILIAKSIKSLTGFKL